MDGHKSIDIVSKTGHFKWVKNEFESIGLGIRSVCPVFLT